MANLNISNYKNLRLRINKDEYWDFYVNKDAEPCYSYGKGIYDGCLTTSFDFCDDETFDGDWIYSSNKYIWEDSIASAITLHNISYTCVDNGLFTFRKDRITNKEFWELYQNNTYDITENDFRLKLHKVSGNTMLYEYPTSVEDCKIKLNGGFYQGFFKTKCGEYEVLPSHFEHGDTFHFEFTLKKCDFEKESDKTLNDKYPENKGIFFYLGTRAENKWIYLYDKEDIDGLEECSVSGYDDYLNNDEGLCDPDNVISNFIDMRTEFEEDPDPFELGDYTNYEYYDPKTKKVSTLKDCFCGNIDDNDNYNMIPFFNACTCSIMYKRGSKKDIDFSKCNAFGEDGYVGDFEGLENLEDIVDYIEDELDIKDFEYETDNGFKFSEANQYYFYTDNKFMLFDRTKNGYTVRNWEEGTQVMFYGRKSQFKGNLFELMNRTKTGYTVHNIDELREKDDNYYNPYTDIYNNAMAFRITDDGRIGYRVLTYDCDIEGRDKSSIIEGYSNSGIIPECEWVTINVKLIFTYGKMKLYFYVNGKLKYVTRELPPIDLRELNDLYEKQEGVPYNISLGGGTQGLAETILPNYMKNPTRVYPLEKNFAGTFIGYISSFRIYNCLMEQKIIYNNFKVESKKESNQN